MLRAIAGRQCRALSRVLTTTSVALHPSFSSSSAIASPRCSFHATAPRHDEFGIATGAEREELEWKRQGKARFDLTPPRGPIGTKEAPMVVESHYDVRIVGCCGGVGEDEHDIQWFHLEKGKTYECSICAQVFQLKVTGVGGQPGHDEHH